MAELSTTSDGGFDPDGREFMAHNTLTHAEQVSGLRENNNCNVQGTVSYSDSLLGRKNDGILFRGDNSEFGDLVSANSTIGEDLIEYLGDEDNVWGEDFNVRIPRLELSPEFHNREASASPEWQSKGHGLQDKTSGVFTDGMKSGNLDKSQTPGDRKEPFKHDELRPQQINVPNQEHNNMRNSDLYADTRCQNSVPVIKSDISMNHDQNLQNNHAHSHEPKTNDNRTESRNQCCAFSHVNTPSHTSLDVAQYRDNSDMSDYESESWHCHTKEVSSPDRVARNQLIAVCTLCSLFMVGETVGGVLSNSLALFTDVLHLASDLISFFISLLAIYLSTKPPSRTMSLGYHRAEVLGALFSVFIIWLVTGVLCYMAIERIVHKHYTEVQPNEMLVTASIGVVFNIVMGIVLHTERCCGGASSQSSFGHGHSHNASVQSHHASHHHHHHHHSHRSRIAYEPLDAHGSEHELLSPIENDPEVHTVKQRHKNINIRAAFIHVIGDIIQSVGVLIASLIIKITDDPKFKLADPVCTFLFSILVLITTITVLRDTLRIIMEGVPRDLTFQGVLDDLCGIQGVKQVHSLVVWALTIDRNAMAVHLAVEPGLDHQTVLEKASNLMKSKYHFIHTTIQVENYDTHHMDSCKRCRLPSK